MRKRKFSTKKLINLSRIDVSALNHISRKMKINNSEVIRQGISLMKSKINKKPKGAQLTIK